jgi:hypothetical protein
MQRETPGESVKAALEQVITGTGVNQKKLLSEHGFIAGAVRDFAQPKNGTAPHTQEDSFRMGR